MSYCSSTLESHSIGQHQVTLTFDLTETLADDLQLDCLEVGLDFDFSEVS